MTRDKAINHIWGLSGSVDGEFCCGRDESEALEQETEEAIATLVGDPRAGLLAAANVLDGYLTMHPNSPDGKDIYHLLQELRYMADNADEDNE
jgi:hypothetical protein